MDFVGKLGGLTRNPLGIIALFISLIYGMSAILLGASVGSLSSVNQTILVSFIAAFPFVVLAVFAWLVAGHHSKLYGPGDYRSDESFLTARAVPSVAVGSKIRAELEEAAAVQEETAGLPVEALPEKEIINKSVPANQISVGSITSGSINISNQEVSQAFILQNLVISEIQSEYGGYISKNISLNDSFIDAAILRESGAIIVEVKNIPSPNISAGRARQWTNQLLAAMQSASTMGVKVELGVLAIITDLEGMTPYQLSRLETLVDKNILIRTFDKDDLLRKYNLPTGHELAADALKIK